MLGVIDIAGGRAVHARGGNRTAYRPVRQIGSRTIEPGDATALADAYRSLFGIDEIYVADLDAITVGRPQRPLIADLARRAAVWLDAGIATPDAARQALATGAARAIVGLETLAAFEDLAAIVDAIGSAATVFSLDLRDGHPLCPAHAGTADTPIDVIAHKARQAGAKTMTLLDVTRVGSRLGADLETIRRVRIGAPDVHLIAGGGLRHLADLTQAAAAGCDGVLIATALQDGRMSAADVAAARRLQPSVSR